jgi:hypothetical protein
VIATTVLSSRQVDALRTLVAAYEGEQIHPKLVRLVERLRASIRGDTLSGRHENLYVLMHEIEGLLGWK